MLPRALSHCQTWTQSSASVRRALGLFIFVDPCSHVNPILIFSFINLFIYFLFLFLFLFLFFSSFFLFFPFFPFSLLIFIFFMNLRTSHPGTHKALRYNQASHKVQLVNTWISKASSTQRAGRTGANLRIWTKIRFLIFFFFFNNSLTSRTTKSRRCTGHRCRYIILFLHPTS